MDAMPEGDVRIRGPAEVEDVVVELPAVVAPDVAVPVEAGVVAVRAQEVAIDQREKKKGKSNLRL